MSISLSIIIVSYNTSDLTRQAIRSVLQSSSSPKDDEIIVVDNASSDGSVRAIKKEFGNRVIVVNRKTNGGFAKANNEGIRIAKGKNILLLNSDTIVQSGALETMTNCFEQDQSVGILSATLLNEDKTFQSQGGALPTLFNVAAWWLWPFPGELPGIEPYQNNHALPKESLVERGWVAGTAMMIRRDVIRQIGGLDEKIFMYAEDVDYCIRARRKKWKIGLVPDALIIHYGSASTNKARAKLGEVRGLLYIFKKYEKVWKTEALRLIFILGAALRYLLFGILSGNREARELYLAIIRGVSP